MLYRDLIQQRTGGPCPFCSPGQRAILEREHAYLTYSLAPVYKHHALVIPKRHVESSSELSTEELADISHLNTEGIRLLHKLRYEFVSLMMRDGPHPGKTVEHLHYHLIPRVDFRPHFDSEQAKREDPREILTEAEIASLLQDFKKVQ